MGGGGFMSLLFARLLIIRYEINSKFLFLELCVFYSFVYFTDTFVKICCIGTVVHIFDIGLFLLLFAHTVLM
jgi:hypothetical protein